METIGKLFSGTVALLATILMSGLLVFKFWAWFIIPAFDVNPIGYGTAIGLTFVLTLFKSSHLDKEEKTMEETMLLVVRRIVSLAMLLFFAWITHLIV